MKNKLLGLISTVALSSCLSFNPGGEIDLSYVPSRTDDKPMYNELKLGLEAYVDTNISDANLRIGGKATTYMNLPTDEVIIGGFDPTRISYDAYGKLFIDDLEFYAFHNCTHPIKEKEYWIGPKEDRRYINHDSITELGIKYKF